ncbi:MAG: threo-3-hydroxy-L-aspartate ammonia-lyase [Bacteroidota bacterium]
MTDPVTFADVQAAAKRLRGVAHRTPVLTSRTLDARVGASVLVKAENFQRTGSFKFRGAYNAIAALDPAVRARGVLTYSSGNHAQGLALAGRLLDVPVTVIMPSDAPAAKRIATEEYGAEVIIYHRHEITREELGQALSTERGLPIIPPYDHPAIVAGQGTAGLELFEEAGPLDVLLVCCGGGGLLSGCALAARALAPNCRVIGVEPAAADDAARSFRTGTLQTVSDPDTIADGARTPFLGAVTFPLVLTHVDDVVTVTDAELLEAMTFLWERMKLVVEPTGALATAALLSGTITAPGQRIGALISGGNLDVRPLIAQRYAQPNLTTTG